MYKNKKAFTLTELMAAVVILGILAAVAMGSYSKAIERSHMAEALSVGSAILEGVNRYYYDNRGKSNRKCPKLTDLDVSVSKALGACSTPTDYCVKTKYFQITVPNSCTDSVSAPSKVTAARINGAYSIVFYPDFSAVSSVEKCVYANTKGQQICQGAGYKTCNSSAECTKV